MSSEIFCWDAATDAADSPRQYQPLTPGKVTLTLSIWAFKEESESLTNWCHFYMEYLRITFWVLFDTTTTRIEDRCLMFRQYKRHIALECDMQGHRSCGCWLQRSGASNCNVTSSGGDTFIHHARQKLALSHSKNIFDLLRLRLRFRESEQQCP